MVKKIKYKIKFWAGLLFAQFLLFYLFSRTPYIISFFEKFFQLKQQIHQRLFSKITFSVGDIFYLLIIIYLLFAFFKIFNKKSRSKYILHILIILNIFYFIYQLFWGMLYFEKPISEKLPPQKITIEEIKKLSLQYINLTNKTRKLVLEDKKGIFKIKNLDALKIEILQAEKGIPKRYFPNEIYSVNNFKPSVFSTVMNYTGILGYYNPFSSEAQYDAKMPPTYIPFTLAHERAHQLGYSREQEANFIGYLICENSQNPELRYSAYLYTCKSLLRYLSSYNPKFINNAYSLFTDEVKRDLENDRKFAEKHEGALKNIFYYMNDWFLKSNQQEGTITYSYYIDLLIRYKL